MCFAKVTEGLISEEFSVRVVEGAKFTEIFNSIYDNKFCLKKHNQ